MRLACLALIASVSAASAQLLDPTTMPRTSARAAHDPGIDVQKYKADVQEAEKHSRAHQCAAKLKAAGLDATPDNIKAQCAAKLKKRDVNE